MKTTIRRLLAGPTAGERTKLDLRTTIPKGTTLLDLHVRGGIATITLSPSSSSGEDATEIAARIAQVVRTADQFTFVTSVRLVGRRRRGRVVDAEHAEPAGRPW